MLSSIWRNAQVHKHVNTDLQNVFLGVGVSVFVYRLLNIISFMRADQRHNANAETNSDFECVCVCVLIVDETT